MSASLARIEERVSTLGLTVIDVHQTVRGYGGNVGLVSKVDAIIEDLTRVAKYQVEIEQVKSDLATLRKEYDALYSTVGAYPTYLWMLHYKTRETITATFVTVITVFMLLSPFIMPEQSKVVWSRVMSVILKYMGVPVDVP